MGCDQVDKIETQRGRIADVRRNKGEKRSRHVDRVDEIAEYFIFGKYGERIGEQRDGTKVKGQSGFNIELVRVQREIDVLAKLDCRESHP